MSETERFLYRYLNVVARRLLRSPLHRLLSRKVLLLTVRGRRSGATYAIPLGYVRDGDTLTCFTSAAWSGWWRNLRGGAPVAVHLRGRRLEGDAIARPGDPAAAEPLDAFLRASPGTARRYGVTLTADGVPDRAGLARAAGDERTVAITIRLDPGVSGASPGALGADRP